MTKRQKLVFALYAIAVICIPWALDMIMSLIPEPDVSGMAHPHAFDYIDDKVFFMGLVLDFGLYLYPLHMLCINHITLNINKCLFLIVMSCAIVIAPLVMALWSGMLRAYVFETLLAIGVIFLLPFFGIYALKLRLYKSRMPRP